MHSAKSRAHSYKTYSLRYAPCALQELMFIFTTEKQYFKCYKPSLNEYIISFFNLSHFYKNIKYYFIIIKINASFLNFMVQSSSSKTSNNMPCHLLPIFQNQNSLLHKLKSNPRQ